MRLVLFFSLTLVAFNLNAAATGIPTPSFQGQKCDPGPDIPVPTCSPSLPTCQLSPPPGEAARR